MNIEKLESEIQKLTANINKESFLYDLLLAYGQPKASITRLKKGDYNLSKNSDEVLWKKKIFFKKEVDHDMHNVIDELRNDQAILKHHPRFIVITDYQTLLAIDTKTDDTLDISFQDLAKYYDFFLPLSGLEKAQFQNENPADIKAAERMGRLYDILLEDYYLDEKPVDDTVSLHALNVFLSRLLFCFFAEDTDIFTDNQFTNAIASHTSEDGSDLQAYLEKLFILLNVDYSLPERSDYPQFLQNFPYVNGGLFADDYPIPIFNKKSRKLLIECGALGWKAINPDIFGSMMQAVVHTEQRSNMGMHYTSVVNIMKVIEPLFLNELKEELEKAGTNERKLKKLQKRLYHCRFFDPACGSGNFLIITFKELCKLEMEIFKRLYGKQTLLVGIASNIRLDQFYGIELDDFAHETAKLSLWLTEHQMNTAFIEVFGDARPTLPLHESGNIIFGNATRLNWEEVCPKDNGYEIYILGNPPYLGARMQSKEQKADLASVFKGIKNYKNLDYISCWFIKGAEFIEKTKMQMAFVSTNSISQGEQVSLLWNHIFSKNLEIKYAHQSFKWTNNAKGNAGVTCVVIGVSTKNNLTKKLYYNGTFKSVKNINAYLISGTSQTIIKKRTKPISKLPLMQKGNMPYDGGNLSLTTPEKNNLIDKYPDSQIFIKRLYGAREFINDIERWCLWIPDTKKQIANSIIPIQDRINAVREMRLSSTDSAANKLAQRPHQFREINEPNEQSIIVPSVTSERRRYIPMDFLDNQCIVTNLAFVIYKADYYLFSILCSHMHMTWVRAVAGRLETRIRYSSALCYNTFPFPEITEEQKLILEDHVFKVLDERECHSEKTMAELYDPEKMPEGLRQAHHEMDIAIEQCYRSRPFKNDEERLEYLFKLYEEMIEKEK